MFRRRTNNHNIVDESPLLVKLIKEKEWENVMATIRELDEDDDDTVILTELSTVVHYDYHPNPKKQNEDDGLPLHFACRYGAPLYVLQKLLEHSPEAISCKNKAGRLPLHEFCMSPEVRTISAWKDDVKFMQAQYTDSLTIPDKDGNLVLHLACRNGLRPIIPFLCQANPDSVMMQNKKGSIPVHCAKTTEIVQYFHNKYPLTAKVKLSNETFDDDDPTQSKFMKNFLKYMPRATSGTRPVIVNPVIT